MKIWKAQQSSSACKFQGTLTFQLEGTDAWQRVIGLPITTEAGLAAIGIEPVVAQAMAGLRKRSSEPKAPLSVNQRKGTKQAELIALLQAPDGASILEITAVTGWQSHSVRGAISGQLKKKLGLAIISEKVKGRGRVYRVGAPDERPSAEFGRRSRRP